MDTISILRNRLLSKAIKHKVEIRKCENLKDAHVYCVIHNIISQSFGPLLQYYIISTQNFTKNEAKDRNGDCSKDGENFEIKASLGGKNFDQFNYVNLKLNE